jgi:hypothetical protein
MYANSSKTKLFQRELHLLGFLVSPTSISVDDERISALVSLLTPRTTKQLQSLLGATNFIREHIPNYTMVVDPLLTLAASSATFSWLPAHGAALANLRQAILSSTPLFHFDRDRPVFIYSDASLVGIGAALIQFADDGSPRLVATYSKRLTPAQRSFHISLLEALAVLRALETFSPLTGGAHAICYVDHSNLLYFLSQSNTTPHILRWAIRMRSYDFELRYLPGEDNTLSDFLSRQYSFLPGTGVGGADNAQDIDANSAPINASTTEGVALVSDRALHDYAASQDDDDYCNKIKGDLVTHPLFFVEPTKDILMYYNPREQHANAQIVLPAALILTVISEIHGQVHAGSTRTLAAVRRRFYFPDMRRRVRDYVSTSDICKRARATPNATASILRPTTRGDGDVLSNIVVDIFKPGTLAITGDDITFTYVLSVKCLFSGYVIFAPLRNGAAPTVAEALLQHVVGYFGCPLAVYSDRGSNFCSKLITALWRLLDVTQKTSLPHAPWSQGSIERVHADLGRHLRALLTETTSASPSSWHRALPII